LTICSAEEFDMDMSDYDPTDRDKIPIVVAACNVVYNADMGAELNGNYFEVDILESDDCMIIVGLHDPDDPSNHFNTGVPDDPTVEQGVPGATNSSYAYLLWDGNKVTGGLPAGDSWTSLSVGDTLGCGFNMTNKSIFFTRNGSMLGTAFEDVTTKSLSPVIALLTERSKQKVKVNFGQIQPFKYIGPEVILRLGVRSTVLKAYFKSIKKSF
jgi:hypothetical protein